MKQSIPISKAIGVPDRLDVQHEYTFSSGEYGLLRYWYKDVMGNYWAYTNAPEGSPDYNPYLGEPLLDLNQPLPHTDVPFFTPEGFKRNAGVPEGMGTNPNPAYNPGDLSNIWFEYYADKDGEVRFIYLDKDVKENPYLWVQQQLRVTDSAINGFRAYAAKLMGSSHPLDKNLAVIMVLADQGVFDVSWLANAAVKDLSFVDKTVLMFGRKFVCDEALLMYLASLTTNKNPDDPLFAVDTAYGKYPITLGTIHGLFAGLAMSPVFLKTWQINQIYSRIMHRLFSQGMDVLSASSRVYDEMASLLFPVQDLSLYVDTKLVSKLAEGFDTIEKAIPGGDKPLGTLSIESTLSSKTNDEQEFSAWVHKEPLHNITDEDRAALEERKELQEQQASEAPEEHMEPEEPGNV